MTPQESLPLSNNGDTLSSISLYIGIPTQEYRTVQGNLTRLIGNVLRLAHKYHEKEKENKYTPLIEGASAYISVFGHWVSKKNYGSRIDDHSEVVEFFMSPDDYYPTLLLVLCEIAYPALLLANQEAILMLLNNIRVNETEVGANHRVMLWKQWKAGVNTSKPTDPGPSPDERVNDHPLQCLKYLLYILVKSAPEEASLQEVRAVPTWLELPLKEPAALYSSLLNGWTAWLEKTAKDDVQIRGTQPSDSYLPTIRIRILLDVACWWLFYGASQTIKVNFRDLWAEPIGEIILRLLRGELERQASIPTNKTFRFESDNPVPNAILWLAFVHDFIAYSFNSFKPCKPQSGDADEDVNLYERPDPLTGQPSLPPPDNSKRDTYSLKFDEFVKRIPNQNPSLVKDKPGAKSYWKKRLDLLEKLNDRHFPDEHLLSAWRFLFELIATPRIALDIRKDARCNSGYCVQWSWLSGQNAGQGPDMWVRLSRIIRESPAIARFWIAPLTVEAVYSFVTLGPDRNPWNFKFRPNLLRRLRELHTDHKQGLSIIKKVAEDAIAGYPIDFSKAGNAPGSLAAFICHLQSEKV